MIPMAKPMVGGSRPRPPVKMKGRTGTASGGLGSDGSKRGVERKRNHILLKAAV